MPRLLFDGKILHDEALNNIQVMQDAVDSSKWNVVSDYRGNVVVLKSCSTEAEAVAWVNKLGDRISATGVVKDFIVADPKLVREGSE